MVGIYLFHATGRRTLTNVQNFVLEAKPRFHFYKQTNKQIFSEKQFHKAIATIWFHLNILETNQSNDLTALLSGAAVLIPAASTPPSTTPCEL